MIHSIRGGAQRFDHVFMDLDGTITESGPGIIHAAQYMFNHVGIREDDEERLRGFIGPPVTEYLKTQYGFTEEKAHEAYLIFREYYERTGIFESRLYAGVTEAIEAIRQSGKRVYLATAKPDFMAEIILQRFGIRNLFEAVFAARRDIGIITKVQVLQSAVRALGRVPGPVMVGDRCYDIEGGRAVGYATAGVLYGYGSKAELAGADYLLDSVEDLTALLGGYDEGIVYRI